MIILCYLIIDDIWINIITLFLKLSKLSLLLNYTFQMWEWILIAHGYSNLLSEVLGGLQSYMAFTQSEIYRKSGGAGKLTAVTVASLTMILLVIWPNIAPTFLNIWLYHYCCKLTLTLTYFGR
jgi:Sulfate permease family